MDRRPGKEQNHLYNFADDTMVEYALGDAARAGFRQDLTFKEKAKMLGFKKKRLQRIVADDIDSAKLKNLKKLADGMGMTIPGQLLNFQPYLLCTATDIAALVKICSI